LPTSTWATRRPRTLLLEVAEGGDLHSQAQARELLARLP
jgi:pilus assembly protein FimV